MRVLTTILFGSILAACMPEDPPDLPVAQPSGPAAACAAKQWQHLIGEPSDAASVIPGPKRVIEPGQAITMDHRPDRTNVDLDGTGRITRVWCG